MKRKAITTSRKRAEKMLAAEIARVERAAEQRGRDSMAADHERRIRDELTAVITPQRDEVALGRPPEYSRSEVILQANPYDIEARGARLLARGLAVRAHFRPKKQYWRCEETGRLVVWWIWEHVSSEEIRTRGAW